jgi:hypothetical protein
LILQQHGIFNANLNNDVILSESEGSAVVLDCEKGKSRSFVPQDDTFRVALISWDIL